MIKKLRNKIAIQMFRDKKFLKAIAFVLLYHAKTGSNELRGYSIRKLSMITGVHASTIKQRLSTLKQRGLVEIKADTLIFKSITSKHSKRNKRLDKVSYNSLAEVEKSLFAILICILQQRKEFIKRAFLDAKCSNDLKVVKRAKAMIRKYAREFKYRELGISYKKIAKKLGVSVKSAFDYVKFAVSHDFIILQNHFKAVFYKNINYYSIEGYTFTTRNYAYKVRANTYEVIGGTSYPLYKYINKDNKGSK